MRVSGLFLALLLGASACTEHGVRAFTGPGGSTSGSGTLRVSVTDDELGGVPVATAGSRPTISLRFAVTLIGPAEASVPDTGSMFAQVSLDTAAATLLAPTDTIPQGTYTSVRLTLTSAQLAIPGATQPVDLLGGTPNAILTQPLTVEIAIGAASSIRIDLNSDDWLTPVASPPQGQPAFTFDGTTSFLDAIVIS